MPMRRRRPCRVDESVIQPGILSIRTRFDEYTGLYVMHCHRLNHEDNGLMALVNVIPAVSIYAVAVPGAPGKPAEVRLYDGNGDRFVATVIPFPGFEGSVNVAMGDVDGDGVLDLIVGAGQDHAPEVVAYAGAPSAAKGPSGRSWRASRRSRLPRAAVSASPPRRSTGRTSDNIIVGSGPGIPSEVKVYRSAAAVFARCGAGALCDFKPYGDDRSGVSIATGFVDFSTGRESIVTAPGAGSTAEVKVFAFPLFKPNGQAALGNAQAAGNEQPVNTASFMPFGRNYRGGVSLATGWLAGSLGGAKRIVVSQLDGPRFGKDLFERLRIGRGSGIVSAEPHGSRPQRTLPRDRRLRAVRRDLSARGSPRPARRRGPTCWSAALRLEAGT